MYDIRLLLIYKNFMIIKVYHFSSAAEDFPRVFFPLLFSTRVILYSI